MKTRKTIRGKKEAIPQDLLLRQEIKNLEALSLAYLSFFICANIGFWVGGLLGITPMPGVQSGLIVISIVSSIILSSSVIFFKKQILKIKFIIFPTAAILIFLGVLFMQNIWIFLAYFPVLAMAGLFNDWKFASLMSSVSIVCFILLFCLTKYFSPSSFIIWFVYLSLVSIIIIFVTKRNYDFLVDSSKMNQEIEESKVILEIKVKARTKELQELTSSLEEKVAVRTKELKEKINEMEKFQKFTIGREMKMMELKKEIKQLKDSLS